MLASNVLASLHIFTLVANIALSLHFLGIVLFRLGGVSQIEQEKEKRSNQSLGCRQSGSWKNRCACFSILLKLPHFKYGTGNGTGHIGQESLLWL